MSATQTKAQRGQTNGQGPSDPLAAAITYEQAIATEAEAIRGEAVYLTPDLFMALRPLLRRTIPDGFITTTPAVKGKPYESTGIKSLQVQIDRMDNVLGPLNWRWKTEYEKEGKVAHTRVWVFADGDRDKVLVEREGRGGVEQGSTQGNIYKGSETNAAKRVFATVGPGHEVYLGATDLDPDVSEEAAEAQVAAPPSAPAGPRNLTQEEADRLEHIVKAAGLFDHLPTKLTSFGVQKLTDLTSDQAVKVYEWAQGEVTNG